MSRPTQTNLALPCPEVTEDPRVEAFRLWIRALDRHDVKAGRPAARDLRERGISVCCCTPARGGAA
jgi:hypothetical protein